MCLSPLWPGAQWLRLFLPLCDDPANPAVSGGGNDEGPDKCLTPGPIPFVRKPETSSPWASDDPPTALRGTAPPSLRGAAGFT